MVVKLNIVKVRRDGSIPDYPVSFPPLENLHLELLEIKKKLKPNLPPLPPSKRPTSIPVGITIGTNVNQREIQQEHFKHDKDKIPSERKGKKDEPVPEKKKKKIKPVISEEDQEMVDMLGDEDAGTDDEGEEGEDVSEIEEIEDGEDGEDGEEDDEEEEEDDDPYAGLSPEEREIREKEEYIWRFRILKKKYRNASADIPDYNEHSDLNVMKKNYERTTRELMLDANVESYKSYLMGAWLAMEYIGVNLIGIDLTGFTIQQTKMMYQYETLLVELGEKNRESWTSSLPVEVRIIGMVVIQAAFFYLGKIVSSRFGSSAGDIFKGMTGQPPEPARQEVKPELNNERGKGGRMRGPKIRAEDIRRMHDQKVNDNQV